MGVCRDEWLEERAWLSAVTCGSSRWIHRVCRDASLEEWIRLTAATCCLPS